MPTTTNESSRSPVRQRRTHILRISRRTTAVAALVLVIAVSLSYTQAIPAPGYATWQDKTSSWLRDHGAASMVNAYENWRYTRHPPSNA
ncbi:MULTISPECIES: hypothetical protein [unclassified Rhodococcus (in: high G+C Gram-positive bacteria)]|uniref:hypothetical protein n=1 Tax=unclassified Rhodococcus (in: high G+C Gram-positive bacteria) TaxID=192944 RepID=UPI00163981F0|nr:MULTISPECIES: hypothetical protein [unclassified Rhodococcus (in: high G+C Gram-positive bacteria)]MBC2644570.1 hypothetical protein [Rhodococcus sp. 3A]MBC2897741.1 hypothetical protein [Rhodococcus sp. 4CII]